MKPQLVIANVLLGKTSQSRSNRAGSLLDRSQVFSPGTLLQEVNGIEVHYIMNGINDSGEYSGRISESDNETYIEEQQALHHFEEQVPRICCTTITRDIPVRIV